MPRIVSIPTSRLDAPSAKPDPAKPDESLAIKCHPTAADPVSAKHDRRCGMAGRRWTPRRLASLAIRPMTASRSAVAKAFQRFRFCAASAT